MGRLKDHLIEKMETDAGFREDAELAELMRCEPDFPVFPMDEEEPLGGNPPAFDGGRRLKAA
jgi:hypothetical protein